MTLRWGIVGAGDIARKISAKAMQLAQGSQLEAVMRTDEALVRQFAIDFDVPRFYTNVEDLINDSSVNVIYIASPVYLHYEHTLLAAHAGKHVLVEKPMALNERECEAMIEACDKNNVRLMIMFYQRFNRLHQELRRLVEAETFGRLSAARSSFTQLSANAPISSKWAWRLDLKKSGGGTLMDTGSHGIDTLRFILGKAIVRVCALSNTVLFDYPVDDTTSALLEFEDGLQAVVTSYWSSPDWSPALVNRLEIYGEKGFAQTSPVNDKLSQGELIWNTGNGSQVFNAEQNTHIAAVEAFRTAIETGVAPPVTGIDGLINTRILNAIYESARQGRFVSLNS